MTVLVAGGTGALGTPWCAELLDAGYDCRLTWVVERERERIDDELGDRVSLVQADLTDPDGGVADVVAGVEDLEAVVNLVGGFAWAAGARTALDDFMRMLELNLVPPSCSRTRRCRGWSSAAAAPSWAYRRAPPCIRSRARPATSPGRRACSPSSRRSTPSTATTACA